MTERVRKTLDFVTEFFESGEGFKNDAAAKNYRMEHSVRVANICREIAREEGMDEEMALIAGLLHDVAYGMSIPEGYDWSEHGRDGARIARPFLESLELERDAIEDICFAIAIHVDDKADFEGRRCPFTETIGDADNIDRFDAYRIYESVRYQAKPEERTVPEKIQWLRQRLERLEQLCEWKLATPTATRLWQDKIEYQKGYFDRLLKQMEASVLSEGGIKR